MVRFGIVGAGNIAKKFAQDIAFVESGKLIAVASRTLEKAQSFQSEFDLPYAFGSYEEMAKSDLIDAVYIATPHNFHMEQSILFLEHGKHVLCEKSVSVNSGELDAMIESAKKNNRVLMEAMWTRYLPSFRYLEKVIQSGDMGLLLDAKLRFGIPLTNTATEEGRILNPQLAGGSLLDVGVYPVSAFRFITKDPIKSMNAIATLSSKNVDLHVLIDIVLDNVQETTVTLESAVDRELSNVCQLTFENGTIEIPHFWTGDRLYHNDKMIDFPFRNGGFEFEIEHFCQTVLNGQLEDSIMTYKESSIVMDLMDQIRKQIGVKYPFEQ